MDQSGTGETLESYGSDIGQRTSEWTRVREWVLVEADRLLVAAIISVGTFVSLLGLNVLGYVAFVNDDSITRLAGGMVAGTFSLVTLVVTVNQLILSREFVAAGESEDKLEGVLSFRDDVAAASAVPASPASPTRLLGLLVLAVQDRAETLAEAVADADDDVTSRVMPYTNLVQESTERIDETLEQTEYGTFRAVSATIGYDDAWQLYVARHLHGRYGDRLSPAAAEAIEELIEALTLFAVARDHLKTTYLQRELTRFSQLSIYLGVPAILAAMLVGFLYGDVGGPTIGTDRLPYVVSGLVAVVVSPLALLASYILRTTTVTRRTASIGPMLPQKDPDEGPFDVTYGEEASGESVGGASADE